MGEGFVDGVHETSERNLNNISRKRPAALLVASAISRALPNSCRQQWEAESNINATLTPP